MKVNYQKETKTRFQLQTAEKLQRILMTLFSKSSFSFQNQQVFVNVIYVDISKDLMNAKAVIDTFGLDEKYKAELVAKLNKDFVKQVRGFVAQKLKVKRVPEIVFYYEEENKKKQKVLDLIEEESKKAND